MLTVPSKYVCTYLRISLQSDLIPFFPSLGAHSNIGGWALPKRFKVTDCAHDVKIHLIAAWQIIIPNAMSMLFFSSPSSALHMFGMPLWPSFTNLRHDAVPRIEGNELRRRLPCSAAVIPKLETELPFRQ